MAMLYCKSAYFVLTLFTLCSGQLIITGNEEPLTIGLSRDMKCTWSGEGNVSRMEWFVVGLEAVAIETAEDSWSVVLTLTPDDDGLDRAMFLCKATLTNSLEIEETITLSIQAIENEVVISASEMNATAGQPYTLLCTVSSERLSNLSWVDPNGVACPLDDPDTTVSYSGWIGGLSTLELTFHSIRTSQSGVYKCISNIAIPPSKGEASFLVQVKIPEPAVSILREPEHPMQLFTTDSLVLTCVIDLIPEVDSYVTVNSQWSGHSSLTDRERRVIVSDLEGVRLTYNTSVTFSTLKSSDSGTYTCSATVAPVRIPVRDRNLIESQTVDETISISVVLKVTIAVTYNSPSDFDLPSPPYYRPGTSVTLTCTAHHAVGSVSYQWSSTCSSCFASSSSQNISSDSILQSNDAGVHTCTVTDSNSNTGSNTTDMKLIGSGLYIQSSVYVNQQAVLNNSLVVPRSRSCSNYYCSETVLDLYCYSNSTSSSVGYYMYPDGNRYSSSDSYRYTVVRQSYSTLQLYGASSRYYGSMSIWGIFTCELPDAEGNTVETSIGIYSSSPSAPSVYTITYNDWSSAGSSVLGNVECHTQNSPPTTVTWTRDGVTIQIDGTAYEMIQIVTERQSYSRYNNTLIIRDALQLAGDHRYCCKASNTAGTSAYQCVSTSWSATPEVEISTPEEAVYSESFQAACTGSLQPHVAPYLAQYLTVNWRGIDELSPQDGITVDKQQKSANGLTKSLVFHPLTMAHGGNYTCEAKVVLPGSAGSFNTTLEHHINVLNRTLIQLKFGPVVHCSKWYEDKHMAKHLEADIKKTLTDLINTNCSCDFQLSQISQGEFSCRSIVNAYVIYRATLTGTSDTIAVPPLLRAIGDWIASDGTFLYTYHGNMRLEIDKECPLEITSFSQTECRRPQK